MHAHVSNYIIMSCNLISIAVRDLHVMSTYYCLHDHACAVVEFHWVCKLATCGCQGGPSLPYAYIMHATGRLGQHDIHAFHV